MKRKGRRVCATAVSAWWRTAFLSHRLFQIPIPVIATTINSMQIPWGRNSRLMPHKIPAADDQGWENRPWLVIAMARQAVPAAIKKVKGVSDMKRLPNEIILKSSEAQTATAAASTGPTILRAAINQRTGAAMDRKSHRASTAWRPPVRRKLPAKSRLVPSGWIRSKEFKV